MNLPNILSIFRLILVPVFAGTYFSGSPNARIWAALVYALAFVTDIADGAIARKFDLITRLGRVLDPVADKLMTFTVILCVCLDGIVPMWAAVVFFCKEAAMALGGAMMLHRTKDVIPSNWLGKASTGVFFVVLAALVLFPQIPYTLAVGLISAALALAIAALLRYVIAYRQVMEVYPKEN